MNTGLLETCRGFK